jgi:hypothetical protein
MILQNIPDKHLPQQIVQKNQMDMRRRMTPSIHWKRSQLNTMNTNCALLRKMCRGSMVDKWMKRLPVTR